MASAVAHALSKFCVSPPSKTKDKEALDRQLSPPMYGYDIGAHSDRVSLQHRWSSKSCLQALKEEMEEQRCVATNWEICSRIAQGLNDHYTSFIPQETLSKLLRKRFGYLPLSLTIWAVYLGVEESEYPVLRCISDEEYQNYMMRSNLIQNQGLADDMQIAWDSIPPTARSLIITMWLTRPDLCKDISHPIPTVDEAKWMIDTDPLLTPLETALAHDIISSAVDSQGVQLFQ